MAQSRNEAILENLLGEHNELGAPMSRVEKILRNLLGDKYELDDAGSRVEKLLIDILEEGIDGGGEGAEDFRVLNSVISRTVESINCNATSIGAYAFYRCYALTDIVFPLATTVSNSAFYESTLLTTADFGSVQMMYPYAFYKTNLSELVIRTDQMCVIGQGSNLTYHALELTPFDELGASTGGTLYVPEALIDTYLANDFWASLFSLSKNSIVAIEGSKYDVG